MEGYGGPALLSFMIGQCLNGGLGWALEASCHRCKPEASIPLDCVRRPKDTPIWKLEASSLDYAGKGADALLPVHMIRLTERRQTTPYVWVHPDEERWRRL